MPYKNNQIATPYGMAPTTLVGQTTYSEGTKKALAAAKPEIPAATKTPADDSVKIATSNLFIGNEPEVTVDQMTEILFDRISSKEILGLAKNNDVANNFQINGLTNNISNIYEIAKSYSSTSIIQIKTPPSIFVEDIKTYQSTSSSTGETIITKPTTVTDTSGNTTNTGNTGAPASGKVQVQVAKPTSTRSGTLWGPLVQ